MLQRVICVICLVVFSSFANPVVANVLPTTGTIIGVDAAVGGGADTWTVTTSDGFTFFGRAAFGSGGLVGAP